MARKQSKFLKQQKIGIAIFAVLAVGAIGYLAYLMVQDAPLGDFVEGEHYQLIENPRRIRSDKIEVIEFFSYACVHCYNFDPDLEDWVEEQGDKIEFVRMPVVSSDTWRILARNYYAMEKLGITDQYHMPFFREIHEARQNINNPARLESYFDGVGVDVDEYNQAYGSADVTSQINRADQMARRLRVASVPTVVIQGKYLVRTTGTIGPKRMLDVMSHLIEKETSPAGAED